MSSGRADTRHGGRGRRRWASLRTAVPLHLPQPCVRVPGALCANTCRCRGFPIRRPAGRRTVSPGGADVPVDTGQGVSGSCSRQGTASATVRPCLCFPRAVSLSVTWLRSLCIPRPLRAGGAGPLSPTLCPGCPLAGRERGRAEVRGQTYRSSLRRAACVASGKNVPHGHGGFSPALARAHVEARDHRGLTFPVA